MLLINKYLLCVCVGFWLLVNSAFGYLKNTILILLTQLILILIEVKLVIIFNDGNL